MPAENQKWSRIHFFTWTLWLFLLIAIRGSEVNAADVITSCPEYFQAGQVNIITCTVNSTSITSAKCYPSATNIDLQLTYSSGSLRHLCSAPYPNISCTQGDCFCANQSGDLLTYQFKIVADSTYEGGNLTCNICEVTSGINPQRVISSNCSTVRFVKTTAKMTATMITTVTTKGTTTGTTLPTTTATVKWKITIVVILPILFIVVVIIGVVVFKWKKLLCFENKTVDPTRSSNERHQNDLRRTAQIFQQVMWYEVKIGVQDLTFKEYLELSVIMASLSTL